MSYNWGRGREDYSKHVTPKAEAILRKAKPLDFQLWETEGIDPHQTFTCSTCSYTTPTHANGQQLRIPDQSEGIQASLESKTHYGSCLR